jgi:hypothetical protein
MKFILMFSGMLILSIPCLFVLLQLARGHESPKGHPGTWNLKSQTCCVLDHFYYPIMFFIITYSCIGLILMGPNCHPSLVIFLPCSPLNYLDSFAIALYGFGINITLCPCSNYSVILFIVHVKIIIFNWNMEVNLRNTCHHKGRMGHPWLTN